MEGNNKYKTKDNKKELGGILKKELTKEEKAEIEELVERVVEKYGETLKLLAQNDN